MVMAVAAAPGNRLATVGDDSESGSSRCTKRGNAASQNENIEDTTTPPSAVVRDGKAANPVLQHSLIKIAVIMKAVETAGIRRTRDVCRCEDPG